MVAADVYELVEDHFDEPVSPDLVLQVRDGSRESALDFGQRYREWVTAEKPRVADKSERQLRPFIGAAYHGPSGVSLYAPAFTSDENQLWALYDGLVHHLLYCHSVGVENPLMHLVTSGNRLPLVSLQGGMLGFTANPTIILSRYIALLVGLQPLVDCGAVILVETGYSAKSGYAPMVAVYRDADPPGEGTYYLRGNYALSESQFAQIKERVGPRLAERADAELRSQYPDGDVTDFMRQERQRDLLKAALGEVARAARVSDRVGDLDLYLRNDFQRSALVEALAIAPEWLNGSATSLSTYLRRQMTLLDRLLQLDLPDLSNLAPGDIRAIRTSDETFNRWRQALSNGLSSVEPWPDARFTEEQRDVVQAEVRASIVEAGLAIDTSINKSDVMKAGKAGLLKLTVGLLLSGGAAAPAAVMHAGQTSGGKLGETAFSKHQQKPLADSIDRHTVLFATSQ